VELRTLQHKQESFVIQYQESLKISSESLVLSRQSSAVACLCLSLVAVLQILLLGQSCFIVKGKERKGRVYI